MSTLFRRSLILFSEQQAAKTAATTATTPPPQLFFKITRTHTNNIPVYLSYTGGARRVPMTEIRRIQGDIGQAHNEVQRLVGSHVNVQRSDGKLKVTGNFVSKVRKHLLALGF